MRDCCYERDTGTAIGDFGERDSGDNHLNEPRTGMSFNENLKNLITQSMRGTRLTSSSGFKRRSSDQRGNENSIRSEIANLSKISIAHRVTWHLRLLRQLKCLTALKPVSGSQNDTNTTLLTC